MKTFEFSPNVITKIISELQDAEEYIRIAVFQIHNREIFNVLNNKLGEGVRVEIITLPYDSINEDIQAEVTGMFQNIERNGAKLYFCKWNVGDPERTNTAVGRWYSFHGKFIVTDKTAVSLSANFTQSQELDAVIVFKNEIDKIGEYNRKFDELIDLFIRENSGNNGTIRQKIAEVENNPALFELPKVIQTETHRSHWIRHYPSSLCPIDIPIEDKLYLAPFDCRGRNFFMSLISEASEFAYISTESFTDMDFSAFLIKMRLKGLDIRILSGATSMDFQDRMNNMLRELLSQDIGIRTTVGDIHAKLVITDKHLVVSSVNLNKMNLGFHITKRYWRQNTESISVCSDTEIIEQAKIQYLNIYNISNDIKKTLAEKIESLVGDMLISIFGLRSRNEVKFLFARLIVSKEIEVKKFINDIGKITFKLMKIFNRNTVEKNDFISALILYYLSESKHNFNQLNEKLSNLGTEIDLSSLITGLLDRNLIERVDDFYKIKLDELLRG